VPKSIRTTNNKKIISAELMKSNMDLKLNLFLT
jgi:hypothetical protein